MSEPQVATAPRSGASRLQLILAGLLCFAAVIPFLGKAVHQDDWAYVVVAQLMLEHGTEVLDVAGYYQGDVQRVGEGVLHGPVWLVCLAIAQLPLFGAAWELVAHLFSAGFLALLGVSVASLAGRVGAPPVATALALCLGPAPLVLAGSLMTDLPMVALFAASIALAVRGGETGKRGELIAAGVLGALAGLTRYHGLAIVFLLGALPLLWGANRGRRWIPLGVCLLILAAFFSATLLGTGQVDAERAREGLALAEIDRHACLLSLLGALGGVSFAALLGLLPGALPALLRGKAGLTAMTGALALVGAGLGLWQASASFDVSPVPVEGVNRALQWVILPLGAVLLAVAARPWLSPGILLRRPEWRARYGAWAFLALWLGGFSVAAWITVPFGSTRYALPALTPLFLLVFAWAGRFVGGPWPALAALLSAGIGFAAAEADRRAAEVYPIYAESVAERVAEGGPWSAGTTWIWGEIDFRYYLERSAGLPILPSDNREPVEGDRILKSMIVCTASPNDGSTGAYTLHPDVVSRMEGGPIERVTPAGLEPWTGGRPEPIPGDYPLRIHHSYAGAGFYGHHAGFLPFAWSRMPHDQFQVWKVTGANPFLESFAVAGKESASYGSELTGGAPLNGRISVERFLADPQQEQRVAIQVLLPGRITWEQVPIPANARFEAWVAEHHRLVLEGIDGPPVTFRLRIGDEVVAELDSDIRRGEPTGWRKLSADLSRFAGRSVRLSLESVDRPRSGGERDPVPKILTGFAEPRLIAGP
jgi:hypothetical protein